MYTLSLIIPAAGSGERMEYETPKPFLELGGLTILEQTILRFTELPELVECIIATGEDRLEQVQELTARHLPDTVELKVVTGGESRQASVEKGVQASGAVDLIAVHDAVRPFVELATIRRCVEKAGKTGAAIVGVPAKNTIKRTGSDRAVTETLNRSDLWQIQTPQIFEKDLLMRAFHHANESGFIGTDDASLVEHMGKPVFIVDGDQRNFKITYPEDLELAELLIQNSEL